MKDLYIGVDIGTSSTKAIVADAWLHPTYHTSESYPLLAPAPGYAEQDADVLISAIMACLREAIHQTNHRGRLAGIGLSCAMHGLLLLDKNHQPLAPMVTWADKRSESIAAELQDTALGRDIYFHTGTPIHPMSPLCKLLWFKQHHPDLLSKTYSIVSIKEYLVFLLTGHLLIDHSIASATGLFDLFTRAWYTPALDLAGITKAQLSTPVSTTTRLPPLLPDIAKALDIDATVPWIIGASDGCLANLGVRANEPTRAALTIGTSGAIRVTTTTPLVDKARRLFTYVLDDARYIVGGSINNGGIMMQWFQEQLLGEADDNDLRKNLVRTTSIPPGSDSLICLPYLLGERAPHWNSFDRGVYFGVQYQHTSAHFLKAMIEGITLTLFQIGCAIEENCGPFYTILANGGVLQSPEWLQIMADVFGKEVVVTPGQDASATGAILLAMQALEKKSDIGTEGPLPGVDSRHDVDRRYLPNPEAHQTYQQLLPVFSDLYDKLRTDFVRLKSP